MWLCGYLRFFSPSVFRNGKPSHWFWWIEFWTKETTDSYWFKKKAYNFNDPSAATLNWSSSMPGLCVPTAMVLAVLQTLDFNRICHELKVKKNCKRNVPDSF